MTANPPPFTTQRLLCDGPDCDAEVIGSAIVQHPRDEHAVERALRAASRDAIDKAMAAGWQVARKGEKAPDLCPKCCEVKR
jgi:hypothetical protein